MTETANLSNNFQNIFISSRTNSHGDIRNTTNCETSVFKKKVDSYLQTILDNPCVPNEDNSLQGRQTGGGGLGGLNPP